MRSDKDVAFLAEKLAQDIRKLVAGMPHLVNKATRPEQCDLVLATEKLNPLGVQSNEQTFWRRTTFDFIDVLRHYSRVASDDGLDAWVPLLDEFNLVH
jgi:hypothetical protein